MGRTYGYDESGSYTAFFIMAPLVLYLVPATFSRLRRPAAKDTKSRMCMC
jgi:preprotein translocase subunit Sec63